MSSGRGCFMLMGLGHADRVLRGQPLAGSEAARLVRLLGLLVAAGMVYGLVMGSYGGFSAERMRQPIYSAVKVPLLLLLTFGLSLPSFFVINTLMGLRDDFGRSLQALLAAQAGLTVTLASLAPFTVVWYLSTRDYEAAIVFNGGMFLVATLAGQWMLRRSYQALIRRDRRHRLMLLFWGVMYAFVGIQMGWMLRPFIGSPNAPTRLFREEAWGNAYIELMEIIAGALGL